MVWFMYMSTLFGQDYPEPGTTGWGMDEADETRDMTLDDIRAQQRLVVQEQDQGLDVLSQVLSRQKQMAYNIGDEVDLQNELIEDITDHVDRTRDRLLRETRNVKIVDRKSGTCGLWAVIILLLVAIIVVAAVPRS